MLLVKPKTIWGKVKWITVYDIPSYFFYFWENAISGDWVPYPKVSYDETMFGVFEYQKEMEDLCFEVLAISKDDKQSVAKPIICKDPLQFKRLIVERLYWAELVIQDVNEAVKVMIGNKLVGDKGIKNLVQVLSTFVSKKEQTVNEIQEGKEAINQALQTFTTEGIYYTDEQLDALSELELAELELEAWRPLVMEKYQHFCDDIWAQGLMNMKWVFADFFGNKFEPKGWQRRLFVNMRRVNIIVSCRRWGKTFCGSYLVARQFYLPNQIIIYVVPTLRNHAKTPRRYLETMFGNDPDVVFDKNDWSVRHKTLKSEIQFISGERDSNVRSSAANLLVFDEAAFLSENMYETAVPLVRTTKGIVYVISTVNPDTPKNWFYYKLIEAEVQMYDNQAHQMARRVTLNDNPFIDAQEKENIIREGQRNPKMFGAEWMCEFQESDSFDLKNFWIIDYSPVQKMFGELWTAKIQADAAFRIQTGGLDNKEKYKEYIICYDAAKKKDQPWLAVLGLTEIVKGDEVVPVVDVVVAGYMTDLEYYDQVKVIVDMYKFFWPQRTTVVVEINNTGIVVEEILRREHRVPVISITAVGWTVVRREATSWYVGKAVMLGKMKTAMSMNQLRGFSFMNELRLEFETFDESWERTDGHHHDLISALRTGIRWASRKGWFLNTDEEVQMYDKLETMMGDAFGWGMVAQLMSWKQSQRGRFENNWF